MKKKMCVIFVLLFCAIIGSYTRKQVFANLSSEFSETCNLANESLSNFLFFKKKLFALNNESKKTIDNPYGAFVRMQTINPSNYQHVVDALVLAKVKVVNIQIYTYVLNLENETLLVKLLNNAGIDVLFRYIWIPRYNSLGKISSTVSVSVTQWEKYLLKVLHEFDGKDGRPYVKYINFLDEPQLYYKQNGTRTYDCVDLVELYKRGYNIVKQIRPDMTVASTTICAYDEDFFNDLFTATLQDGTKFSDYIDILYLDYYANRNTDLYPEVKIMYNSINELQPEMLEKPMWFCCGTTSYNRLPEARAETIVKFIITSFFAGAETFNLYSFVMGGGCSMKAGDSDYYGIISPSVTNSYISLLRVSEPDRAVGAGDAFKKVYLGCPDAYPQTTFDYCYFHINEEMAEMMKREGFIISGKSFSFTKVIINNGTLKNGELVATKTLYKGYHSIGPNGENALTITANELLNLKAHDKIIIYYDRKAADVSNRWDKLETYKTFDSFVSLQTFLNPGSTRPQITDISDMHIACWTNNERNVVYCIFRDDFVKNKRYSFEYKGKPTIYDIYANTIDSQLEDITIGSAPIYITGITKLKLKRHGSGRKELTCKPLDTIY